ncbi:MAG: hypothetical protein JST01_29065 [Cyanobacteria bacterium SZAS TMP-1]|nr:hypothetical protein [Cyanobacteria bacterium SZAS TMP-1]
MSSAKGYIVRRETQDNGPMGSTYGYVKVTQPFPGETIYHGQFRPVNVNCGQYDADTRTEYVPVGPITEEKFGGGEGTETF